MFAVDKFAVAMLFIGAGLGGLIKELPPPADFLNPFLSIVFLIVGVLFLISRQN
ncbi:MAG TPA: hypothetical protein HA254_03000 [Candidatus Diapherotrites archaeon]|uniref:Uncharacterized protein n=1 Tax=Candidatus Iainarchaeum sp. TaxID=3101447 RepID=A0A7J4J0M6_9ARCH|nr:hypothetical protein [Candidatus Diapherotrites archaeon]